MFILDSNYLFQRFWNFGRRAYNYLPKNILTESLSIFYILESLQNQSGNNFNHYQIWDYGTTKKPENYYQFSYFAV